MNKLEYLLKLKSDPKQIYYTWKTLGSMTANNSTKMYVKDNLFKITEKGNMYGAYVFCIYEYTVNTTKGFNSIDWTTLDVDTVDGTCYFYQGVASPNFRVILTPEEAKVLYKNNSSSDDSSSDDSSSGIFSIDPDLKVPDDFMPFAESQADNTVTSSGIIIPDEEYKIIMAELGIPFLDEDELEYNKDTIVQICIKPALDFYYSYFPLVIDEAIGNKSSGVQWKVAYHSFPKNKTAIAYKADAYMTLGTGSSGTSAYSSAFTFMRTEMMGMGSYGIGSRWGNGLRYQKPVPGYVGLESSDAALMAMATRQGYLNYFRREYSRDVIENGKKYVQGYTTIGGFLNIHWLCTDLDYNHIPYTQLTHVRKLCTAYALRNVGAIRNLLKTDENVPFNVDQMNTRADALEQEVKDLWLESNYPLSLAISRGGLS